jgi:methionine-rich copper-binding protein CopC
MRYRGAVTRHRPAFVVAAVLLASLTVALPAAPAAAHTELTRAAPAAGSTATRPVATVTLTFSGLVKKAGSTVRVTGPDNVSYSDGAPSAVNRSVTQKVTPLPVGTINVTWRVLAADGHPIQGRFTFTNRAAPPAPTTAVTTAPPTTPAPAEGSTGTAAPVPASREAGDDGSSPAAWWAMAAAATLALALAGGLFWRRRRSAPGA